MDSKKIIYNGAEYTVYEDGTIVNTRGRKLKWFYSRDGYPFVNTRDKTVAVHRLVAMAFVDNPNGYNEVDHLDSNRNNPHASNLEWVTHAENVRRAEVKGAYKGERNSSAKLTEVDVYAIRLIAKAGFNARQISEMYPVSQRSIEYIIKGDRWKYLPMPSLIPISLRNKER